MALAPPGFYGVTSGYFVWARYSAWSSMPSLFLSSLENSLARSGSALASDLLTLPSLFVSSELNVTLPPPRVAEVLGPVAVAVELEVDSPCAPPDCLELGLGPAFGFGPVPCCAIAPLEDEVLGLVLLFGVVVLGELGEVVVEGDTVLPEGDGEPAEVWASAPPAASASVEKAMTVLIAFFTVLPSMGVGNDDSHRTMRACRRFFLRMSVMQISAASAARAYVVSRRLSARFGKEREEMREIGELAVLEAR